MEVSVYNFLSDNNTVKTKRIPRGPVNIGVNGIPSNNRCNSVKSDRPYTRTSDGDQVPLCWDDQLKQRDVRVMTPKLADSRQQNSNAIERHTLTYDHAGSRSSRPKICDRAINKSLKDKSNVSFFRHTKILHGCRAVDNFLWKQEERKENTVNHSPCDTKPGSAKTLDCEEELLLPIIRLKQTEKSEISADGKSPAPESQHDEGEGITKVHITSITAEPSPRITEVQTSGSPVKSILKQPSSIIGPTPSTASSPRVMFRTSSGAPDLTVVASNTSATHCQSRPFSQPARSRTAPASMMSHPRIQNMRGLVRGFYLHKSTAAQGASFVDSHLYGRFGERPLFFNFVSQPVTERKVFSYGKAASLPVSRRSGRNYYCGDPKAVNDITYAVDGVDVDTAPHLDFQRKSSEPGEAPALPNTPVSAAAFTNIETEESDTELEVPVPHVKVTFGDRR